MKDDSEKPHPISWKTCFRLAVCALVVFLLIRYWGGIEGFLGLLLSGVSAICAGMVIAYVVNIPMRFFESKLPGPTGDGTRNRVVSMILAIVCIVLVLLFVVVLVVPHLASAIVTLVKELPHAVDTLMQSDVVASIVPTQILGKLESVDWQKIINDVVAWLQSGVVSTLPQIISLFGQIAVWFMGIVFAFWYLAEKNNMGEQCHRLMRVYVGVEADEKLSRAIALVDDCFSHYIVGQLLEAFIFGALVAIGSMVFGLPYPLLLGVLVGVMSLIPMIGALIGAILGALIILATSWQQAILFLIVFFVIQQIESNFIYRNVVGKQVGLSGMWPLIGVTLGMAVFGIAGAFIGVPITSAIFRILNADLARREEKPVDELTPFEKLHDALSDEPDSGHVAVHDAAAQSNGEAACTKEE